jgi:hypothetical protein
MPNRAPQGGYNHDDEERLRREIEQSKMLFRQELYGTDDEDQLQTEIDEAEEGR